MGTRILFAFTLVCFTMASMAPAQENAPTFRDVINLKWPFKPVISPDGKSVLYVERTTDWKKNGYLMQIRHIDINTGECRQLTHADSSSRNPLWSPDGTSFAFVSNRGNGNQIFLYSFANGTSKQLSHSDAGIGFFSWSPDGKTIGFIASNKRQMNREAKYQIDSDNPPGSSVFLIDVSSGETKKLIGRLYLDIRSFSWSSSGNYIALSGVDYQRKSDPNDSDIFIFDVTKEKLTPIVLQPGPDNDPIWSPDDEFIAFTTIKEKMQYYANNEIAIIPFRGNKIKILTGEFDNTIDLIDWQRNNIYFLSHKRSSQHLFRLTVHNSRIEQVTSGAGLYVNHAAVHKDGSQTVFTAIDPGHYFDVHVSSADAFSPKRLTKYTEQLRDWELSKKEVITWKSSDGIEIEGILLKPQNLKENHPYPLLVFIHGGPVDVIFPRSIQEWNELFPFEQWVAKGALVLLPNYRGSTGYGEHFRRLNFHDFGEGEARDIIAGVDYLIDRGMVDSRKVGVMGWSYGGYISAYLATTTKRFSAACVGAGIADWQLMYGVWPYWLEEYSGTTPWKEPDYFRRISPFFHVNPEAAPTLIIHGDRDRSVPPVNAELLYYGLKREGVPVKKVIFNGFGHGIWSPMEKLAFSNIVWEWFDKYVWGQSP